MLSSSPSPSSDSDSDPASDSDLVEPSWGDQTSSLLLEANKNIGSGNPREGIRDLIKVGGLGLTEGYHRFQHALGLDDLKKRGNFIFQIGNVAALATFGPLALFMLLGVSALVPAFLMISSAAGAFREFTIYYNELLQLRALRIQLPSSTDLLKRMLKAKISDKDISVIRTYVFEQDKIYQSLYALRKELIDDPKLSNDDKKAKILKINNIIEKLSKGEEIKEGDLDILKELRKLETDKTIENITKFEAGRIKFPQINMSKSLKERMQNFITTRNSIYAQDLPHDIKDKLGRFAEGDKVKKDELYQIYAQIGNHYINTNINQQLDLRDNNIEVKVAQVTSDENDQRIIRDYYLYPRKEHDNEPDRADKVEVETKYEEVMKKLRGSVDNNTLEKLDYSIQVHRESSLSQYIGKDQDFPSPDIAKINPKDEKAPKKVSDEQAKAENVGEKAKNWMMHKFFGKKELNTVQEKIHAKSRENAKEDFSDRYAATFDIVKKSERINFLEKSVPRRLANVGIAIGTFAITLLSTAVLPVLVSPAAPAYVPISMVLGGLSVAMTGACLANGLHLEAKGIKSKNKIAKPKKMLSEGVATKTPKTQMEDKKDKSLEKVETKRASAILFEEPEHNVAAGQHAVAEHKVAAEIHVEAKQEEVANGSNHRKNHK